MVVGKPAGFTLLLACGGDQAPALQAEGLGSPHQPLWGMLGKMQSHSCLCGWSGQGYTPLCKCCPLKGVAGWAVGAGGSRDLLRHTENAHPQGYAGKLLPPGQQPLGRTSEREILGEGISPRVCTNWRCVCCHGPQIEAKPGMPLHVLGGHSLGAQLALVPWGISRSLNLPKEGSNWVEQEICPGTKLPACSLMFSFSFCFRGQRGLAPLKQTENEDRGKPALPTPK